MKRFLTSLVLSVAAILGFSSGGDSGPIPIWQINVDPIISPIVNSNCVAVGGTNFSAPIVLCPDGTASFAGSISAAEFIGAGGSGIPYSEKGAALGVATLDASAKLTYSEIPDSLLGGVSFQGIYDVPGDSPTLPSCVSTTIGYYYIASVAGTLTQPLYGYYDIGDWVVCDATGWTKVDNVDSVTSVNARIGDVTGLEETSNKQQTIAASTTFYPSNNAVISFVNGAIATHNAPQYHFDELAELINVTLPSCANGMALVMSTDNYSWTCAYVSGTGDNLGSHVAGQNLNMSYFAIINAADIELESTDPQVYFGQTTVGGDDYEVAVSPVDQFLVTQWVGDTTPRIRLYMDNTNFEFRDASTGVAQFIVNSTGGTYVEGLRVVSAYGDTIDVYDPFDMNGQQIINSPNTVPICATDLSFAYWDSTTQRWLCTDHPDVQWSEHPAISDVDVALNNILNIGPTRGYFGSYTGVYSPNRQGIFYTSTSTEYFTITQEDSAGYHSLLIGNNEVGFLIDKTGTGGDYNESTFYGDRNDFYVYDSGSGDEVGFVMSPGQNRVRLYGNDLYLSWEGDYIYNPSVIEGLPLVGAVNFQDDVVIDAGYKAIWWETPDGHFRIYQKYAGATELSSGLEDGSQYTGFIVISGGDDTGESYVNMQSSYGTTYNATIHLLGDVPEQYFAISSSSSLGTLSFRPDVDTIYNSSISRGVPVVGAVNFSDDVVIDAGFKSYYWSSDSLGASGNPAIYTSGDGTLGWRNQSGVWASFGSGGGWVGTAESDLDMAGFQVTNATSYALTARGKFAYSASAGAGITSFSGFQSSFASTSTVQVAMGQAEDTIWYGASNDPAMFAYVYSGTSPDIHTIVDSDLIQAWEFQYDDENRRSSIYLLTYDGPYINSDYGAEISLDARSNSSNNLLSAMGPGVFQYFALEQDATPRIYFQQTDGVGIQLVQINETGYDMQVRHIYNGGSVGSPVVGAINYQDDTTLDAGYVSYYYGTSTYTNQPAFRLNPTTFELEYRDEDEAGWTTLDSLSGGGTAHSLGSATHTDVNITSPSNGQVLLYESSSGDWINSTVSGSGDNLGDHTATQDLDMNGNDIIDIGALYGFGASNIYINDTLEPLIATVDIGVAGTPIQDLFVQTITGIEATLSKQNVGGQGATIDFRTADASTPYWFAQGISAQAYTGGSRSTYLMSFEAGHYNGQYGVFVVDMFNDTGDEYYMYGDETGWYFYADPDGQMQIKPSYFYLEMLDSQIVGDWRPGTTNLFTLGNTSYYWNTTYTTSIYTANIGSPTTTISVLGADNIVYHVESLAAGNMAYFANSLTWSESGIFGNGGPYYGIQRTTDQDDNGIVFLANYVRGSYEGWVYVDAYNGNQFGWAEDVGDASTSIEQYGNGTTIRSDDTGVFSRLDVDAVAGISIQKDSGTGEVIVTDSQVDLNADVVVETGYTLYADSIGQQVSTIGPLDITATTGSYSSTLNAVVLRENGVAILHDNRSDYVGTEHLTPATLAGFGLVDNGTAIDVKYESPLAANGDTLGFDETAVNHDNLLGFVGTEHLLPTTLAGFGLVDNGTALDVKYESPLSANGDTLGLNEGAVNHDNLAGFVTTEHLTPTQLAGVGLTPNGTAIDVKYANGITANGDTIENTTAIRDQRFSWSGESITASDDGRTLGRAAGACTVQNITCRTQGASADIRLYNNGAGSPLTSADITCAVGGVGSSNWTTATGLQNTSVSDASEIYFDTTTATGVTYLAINLVCRE